MADLRKLLKKPAKFIDEFALTAAEFSVEEYNSQESVNDVPAVTGESQIEDYGSPLGFIDSECSNVQIDGLSLREVDGVGGGEGGGELVMRVWAIIEGATEKKDKYGGYTLEGGSPIAHIRATGFYSSYEGIEWDDESPELVFPQEVKITKYFNSKELKRIAK